MIKLIRSEWTKLVTTKAFYWVLFSYFALNMAFGWLGGWSLKYTNETVDGWKFGVPPTLTSFVALQFFAVIGFIPIIAGATMMITGEYRHNYAQSTFLAAPNRWLVALAKLVLYGVFAAATTFAVLIATLYAAKLGAGSEISATLNVFDNEAVRKNMWVYPAGVAAIVVMTQAISWLFRHSAGAMTLMIVWQFGLESILGGLPKIGTHITDWGPTGHLQAFLNDVKGAHDFTVMQNYWYYLACAVALYVLSIIVLERRDA